MSGLNVDITADTRQFQAEVDNVPVSLAKISDELNQVTESGDKAGQSLESNLRQAQQASEETQSVFRQQTDTFTQGYHKQTEEALLSNREINSIQKESLKTTAGALAQTVEQSASAFDGTVNGAIGAIQNIATGVSALSGNAALAAGAGAIALLVAGIGGALQKQQELTQAEKATVATLTEEMEKLGVAGVGSVSQVNDELSKFSTTTDGTQKDLEAIKALADQGGVSWVSYARALAGSTDDQKKLYDSVQALIPPLEKQIKLAEADNAGRDRSKLESQLDGLLKISDALETQNHELGVSKDRVDDLASAQRINALETKAAADAQKEYSDATLATFDNIGSDIASKQAQINATARSESEKTKKTVVANNIETAASFAKAQRDELKTLESNNAAKIRIYEKFGADADQVIKDAGDNTNLLKSLAAADPKTVTQIIANYGKLGKDAAQNLHQSAQAELSGANLALPPPSVPDLSKVAAQYRNAFQSFLNSHPVQVPLVAKPHFGRNPI